MRRFGLTSRILNVSLLMLSGWLSVGLDATWAQQPGPPVDRPPEGGFRRGRMGGDPNSFLSQIRDEKFRERVKLTEEQVQKFDQLRMDMFTAFRNGASREDIPNIIKEFEQKGLDILTADQKTIWEERKAELKAAQPTGDGDRPGPPGYGRPSSAGDRTGSTPPSPPRRTEFNEEKPPEGAKVTASFGTRLANASTTGGKPVPVPEDAKSSEARLSFNFRYAPWSDVLKLFSEAAGLTLDLNDVPPGTFNYFDDKTYTVTEALDVLNGYLLPKGYVLIRRDRFLVSLNIDNGPIPPNLVPNITIEELPQRGANELLSLVIPLEGGLEADKIVGEVRELVGPQGKVSALKNTNSLVVMDTGSNLNRIYYLLKAGAGTDTRETVFRAIALKHISAAEAERTVRRLFGLNTPTTTTTTFGQGGFSPFSFGGGFGGGFGGPPGFSGFRDGRSDDRSRDDRSRDERGRDSGSSSRPTIPGSTTPSPFANKIQVTADTRTNHLLVTTSATLLKVVEELVKSIDVDRDVNGNQIVSSDDPASLKAYSIPGGDVTQVSQTLNSMMPGLVVGVDSRAGKIHVFATKKEHDEIERLVKTLAGDGSGGSVAVITLSRLDPVQAANTLKNLFVSEARPPTIEADAFGRRLLVRGSADQLAQVKILLTQLGEAGAEPQAEVADRGNVRTIPLTHDPQDVLPLIKQMWDATERSPIRVVVPSQPSPIRDRRVPGARGENNPAAVRERINLVPERSSTTEPATSSDLPAGGASLREKPRGETILGPASRSILRTPPRTESTGPRADAPRKLSILQVSRTGENAHDAAADDPKADDPANVTTTQEAENESTDAKGASKAKSQSVLSIVGDQLVITGDDKQELDQLEDMINTLIASIPVRTRWTVFYLRSADATETAQMLERLFPQSSVTASTSSSDGLFGSLTGGLSNIGRGMMNVTGLNQTLSGAGNLRIITDIRSNALFVTGPPDMIREVEYMLELLDSAELPESLRDRLPRSIPVEYAEIDEVAEIVESVFKDATTPEQAQQQGGRGFNPLQMLMGGGGGGGGGGNRKQPGVELTIGIDRRTSHLIVACNDSLFQQVDGLVKSLDDRARDARQTVQIMRLQTADPALVQSTLSSLIPKVTISSTGGSQRKPQPGARTNEQQGQRPPDAVNDPDVIRRAMEQRMRERSGGDRGRSGSDGGRGGFPGGGGFQFGGGSRGGGDSRRDR